VEFFDLPADYDAEDIVEIINNCYLLKTGEVVGHHSSFDTATKKEELQRIYRERQFFECYVDNL
jgi:ABC-type lipopolysaccharide export system ATPase subunit